VPDFVLASAGAVIFAVATWASLAFGYQVFANLSDDEAPDASPDSPLDRPDLTVGRIGPGRFDQLATK